jgi:hypothetical protein
MASGTKRKATHLEDLPLRDLASVIGPHLDPRSAVALRSTGKAVRAAFPGGSVKGAFWAAFRRTAELLDRTTFEYPSHGWQLAYRHSPNRDESYPGAGASAHDISLTYNPLGFATYPYRFGFGSRTSLDASARSLEGLFAALGRKRRSLKKPAESLADLVDAAISREGSLAGAFEVQADAPGGRSGGEGRAFRAKLEAILRPFPARVTLFYDNRWARTSAEDVLPHHAQA